MNPAHFGMNTATLAGPLEARLEAMAQAGFTRAVLWGKDLVGHPQGVEEAVLRVRASGLRISGFQVVRDFEGLSGRMRDYKLDIARSMLRMMPAVGADLLLVCSSSSPHAGADPDRIAGDLATLATLATPLGIRIGYEALAWGRWVSEYSDAWKIVEAVERDNVGLVLDSFQLFARGTSMGHLDAIPSDKIFLVQLSDYLWDHLPAVDDIVDTSRRHRVFPGEGPRSDALVELVRRIQGAGYGGDYVFEVFNEDYLHCPLPSVAARAGRAAHWLAGQLAGGAGGQ